MTYRLEKTNTMKQFKFLLIALVFPFFAFSADQFDKDGIPVKPNPPRLVNDFANIIPANEEAQMESYLEELALSSKTRVVVVTTTTLNNYDKSQFAYEIGERWGVGDAKFDNGIVMLVKPKEVDGKGSTFIATGYGLEGILPDATAKRIVEKEMIPRFKNQDYVGGIAAGLQIVSDLALKEYPASAYDKKATKTSRRGRKGIGFLGMIAIFIIFSIISRIRNARYHSMSSGTSFWSALFLANAMRGSSHGSWSDFSSGGGGFGGFGGGSFGGGGAGGDW
jgi:uncharacterized protein